MHVDGCSSSRDIKCTAHVHLADMIHVHCAYSHKMLHTPQVPMITVVNCVNNRWYIYPSGRHGIQAHARAHTQTAYAQRERLSEKQRMRRRRREEEAPRTCCGCVQTCYTPCTHSDALGLQCPRADMLRAALQNTHIYTRTHSHTPTRAHAQTPLDCYGCRQT